MRVSLLAPISLLTAAGTTLSVGAEEPTPPRYAIVELGGPGSSASSITDPGLVAGSVELDGGAVVSAVVWRDGIPDELGTLGGPNSAILWPNKNNGGIVVGIAETDELDPRGELWSCSAFFPSNTGHVCRGFVYEGGRMRALPTHGGTHGFATGVNNRGLIVGWAETADPDPTCASRGQVLGFVGAVWDTRDGDRLTALPPLLGDSTSAATAINDRGHVVGISGICDQAVGRFSARNMAVWVDGVPSEIESLGAGAWNTPMAINNAGAVVGFANDPGAVGGTFNERPFRWTRRGGIEKLDTLPGSTRGQALGVNERGQVVGLSRVGGLTATLWDDGRVLDLNDLAVDFDGHLLYANDINADGVMAGAATNAAGELVAFVAIPLDE